MSLVALLCILQVNYIIQTEMWPQRRDMNTYVDAEMCVSVWILPTAWGDSICVNPAENVMSTTG